jgi:hypothetical protein
MSSPENKNKSGALVRRNLLPLNIIRSETVLSKLPIHNLAKTGRVAIEIKKKNEFGKVDLLWEVSYSDRYGQPRQLAYKLDTIYINRRIDEEGKPLPKIIRLGSLREICDALDLGSGGNAINRIKTALRQNAFTGITAKFTYKAKDGSQQEVDASDTRYGVVFTGERLPNGRRADGVYILLHDFYWEILNNAPVRPLDYDYLKSLTPASQRFYEIISYRIYAAIKYKLPHAKISYSDYCTYSAQQRYYDYDHFKKQMYKVHRPHMQSGYLAKTSYEETEDGEGHIDWVMYYTPGAKAQAEYAAFTRKAQVIDTHSAHAEAEEDAWGGSFPDKSEKAALRDNGDSDEGIDLELLEALVKRGVTKSRAQKLLSSISPDQPVLDQLEWGDHLVAKAPKGKFENPPGFYIYLVQSNVFVPSSYETTRRRQTRAKAREAEEVRRSEKYKLEDAYASFVERELDNYIEHGLTDSERENLFDEKRRELLKQHSFTSTWGEEQLKPVLYSAVRSTIYDRVPLMSFEDFSAEQATGTHRSRKQKD